jgi:signal transduction histidine kinase
MTISKLDKSKQDFVILLGRIVSLYGIIYSLIFYFTGAPGTAVLMFLTTLIFYPLMIQFFRLNYDTAAKFALIAHGLFLITVAIITNTPDIKIEFYFIPLLLIPLLVFDGKQQFTEILCGAILPLIFWILLVNHILPPIPQIQYNLYQYQIFYERLNFIGAFSISIFFLNFYRIYMNNLNAAINLELEKFKNLSQHLNTSQRIAKIGSWQYNFKADELIWSDEIYRIFEVSRDSFSPTMELFDEFVHPEDFPSVTKTFRAAIANNEHYEIVHRIILKEDRIKFLREQCEIIYDQSGEPELAMGTTQDITESKFNDAFINHSAKMAAVGEMAGSIAHEINNPLTVISGRTKSLLKKLNKIQMPDESIQNDLKSDLYRIVKHVDRISKIVKSLGSISRNDESDPMQLIPIQKIFDDILELSSECFRANDVELRLETSTDAKLLCHPSEMSQVLLNLINNAFDAVNDLDEKWVNVHTIQENNLQRIVVKDSGKGIPKPISEKLMYPFFTTKPLGKGTGLGLPICKRIVEKHNGKLFYDEQSSNTCFVIELPLNQAPADFS